jgi:hypothetical protein
MESVKSGTLLGAGVAINVEVGWVPDSVEVWNVTDGSIYTIGFLNDQVIPFTAGGASGQTVVAGDTIVGATSKARAVVQAVLISSGTFAAGNAVGIFVVNRDNITGTFQAENVAAVGKGGGADAAVTANVTHSMKVDTAAATVAGNNALTPYVGAVGSNSKGFTIGSAVATAAKVLRWRAWRDDR